MESLELIKSGLDIVDTLVEYLAKDAIGSSFLNEYLLGRDAQAEAAKSQQATLEKLINSSKDMESSTKEIASRASDNNRHLGTIHTGISALKETVEKIENDHKKYVEQFQRLSKQIVEITKLIGDIQNISEQTNLLSFNASIEAAHAGSVGAGFRIIANEVKKLSENTRKTTEQILHNVNLLQSSIGDLENETKKNSANLNELSNDTNSALEKFSSIQNMNSGNNSAVEKISGNIAENVQTIQGIIQNIQESENLSKKNVSLFADCASRNQMLFNDLYSFVYEIKAVFEDLKTAKSEEVLGAE